MAETATIAPPELSLLKIKKLIRTHSDPLTLWVDRSVVDIGDNLIVTFGKDVCSSEVEAMKYISERTSIPIPRVVAYYNEPIRVEPYSRMGYIVMTKLPGKKLRDLLKGLNADQTTIVAADLKNIVSELGRLDEPGRWGMIGKGGVFHKGYFTFDHSGAVCAPRPSSPMADIKAHLLASLNKFDRKPFVDGGVYAALIDHTFKECDSAFSHGDLCPDYILVDPETYRITGVVNWAYAGWYPCFWDHFAALDSERAGTYHLEESENWHDIYSRAINMYGDGDEAICLHLLIGEVMEDEDPKSFYARCECCDA